MSPVGTSLPFSDVRSHVGNQGISGLVMLTLSFVDPDPSAMVDERSSMLRRHVTHTHSPAAATDNHRTIEGTVRGW
jgi:hypothetical protein